MQSLMKVAMASGEKSERSHAAASVVVDELLCFVVNKIDTLPPASLIKICAGFYDEAKIEESKKLLFDLCSDASTKRYIRRQGANKSTTNIEDIIKLLQEKGSDIPTFVAMDLGKLPPITFDSIDVSSLLSTLKNVQSEVALLKDTVTAQGSVCTDVRDVCHNMERRVSSLEENATAARTSSTPTPDTDNNGPVSWSTVVKGVNGRRTTIPGDVRITTQTGPAATGGPTTATQTHAQHKAPSKNNASAGVKRRRQEGIIGCAKTDEIKVKTSRMVHIFASRFEPGQSTEGLKSYLVSKLGFEVTCTKIDTIKKKFTSFHVQAECQDPQLLLDPDIWPEGAYVRRYYVRREKTERGVAVPPVDEETRSSDETANSQRQQETHSGNAGNGADE